MHTAMKWKSLTTQGSESLFEFRENGCVGSKEEKEDALQTFAVCEIHQCGQLSKDLHDPNTNPHF